MPIDEFRFKQLLNEVWSIGENRWHLGLCTEKLKAYLLDCTNRTEVKAENARDLYIACACFHRIPDAIKLFTQDYLDVLRWIPWSFDVKKSEHELVDILIIKLFYQERPAIRSYHGGFPLAKWLRVVIERIFVDEHRKIKRDKDRLLFFEDIEIMSQDPSFDIGSEKFATRNFLVKSVHSAFQSLSYQQRTLLKEYYSDKNSTIVLARTYQVHHSTISSRIKDINTIVRNRIYEICQNELKQDPNIFIEHVAEIADAMDIDDILGLTEEDRKFK